MADQTPSTEQVRNPMSSWLGLIIDHQSTPWDPPNLERIAAIRAEWEADLAAHDREVAAKALREAADEIDQTPSTCPACGVDLRYPNALHVVDCPAPVADQTPIVETDVVRECATEMNTCLSDGPAAFDAWIDDHDQAHAVATLCDAVVHLQWFGSVMDADVSLGVTAAWKELQLMASRIEGNREAARG